MSNKTSNALEKIRKIADYQFGKRVGERLFPENVTIVFSKRTRKIRYVYLNGTLLATLKPSNGLFSLTIEGANRFMKASKSKRLWVQVQEETAVFVEKGSDVFARHVINADEEIRPGEEVVILDGQRRVIAVGKAMLSGKEMRAFQRGIAVKVRRGDREKIKKRKETIVDE